MKRAVIVVLDSLGIGDLPDAADFGDHDANTLCHIAKEEKLKLPNLEQMGIANIVPINNIDPVMLPTASWGKMASKSFGKDTTTGHWEIAGLLLGYPLPLYPEGFPNEIIEPFCHEIGRSILGNKVASGTAIIEELGKKHMETGYPIVYTSADSVFQVAAHEEVIPVETLYDICLTARKLLTGKHSVGRVIARPFIGEPGNFKRTENRKDFSLLPPPGGLLEKVKASGKAVTAIGKISDIFAGQGITESMPAHSNPESTEALLAALKKVKDGLIFANFVDFDMLYGHRNDVCGYRDALEKFDQSVPDFLSLLGEEDLFIITADHGNDPTTKSFDHNREYVPLLVYSKKYPGVDLGVRSTFADLGQTVADYLSAGELPNGESFLPLIIK